MRDKNVLPPTLETALAKDDKVTALLKKLAYIFQPSYNIKRFTLLSDHRASLIQVINPPIYLISILPGICVWLFNPHLMSVQLLILATFAVVLLQHGINLHNDVTDWHRGTDPDKFLSWARYYDGNTYPLMQQTWISLIAGALLGLYALYSAQRLEILLLATPLVIAGYLYNAESRPLSYTRFGEWVTAICYGPGVFGCLWWLSADQVSMQMVAGGIFGSLAFAGLAAAILLSHQPPQIETDAAVNKVSYAVRHGKNKTYRMSRRMFLLFGIGLISLNLINNVSQSAIIVLIAGLVAALFFLFKSTPCPPKVLIPATLMIGINGLLQLS